MLTPEQPEVGELYELIDDAAENGVALQQVDQGEDLGLQDGQGGRRTQVRDFLGAFVCLLVSDVDVKLLAKNVSPHGQEF